MRWRFLLLVFGLSLILVGGVQEILLWRVAAPAPQALACRELLRSGPGSNAHIVLREFVLCTQAFVYEERGGRWTVAWVPAVPRGAALDAEGRPRGQDIGILVKMPRARSMADVVHAAESLTLQGMVTNAIERLGRDEAATLQRSYPEVDFERCLIFELDRTPAALLPVLGSLVGGSLVILYLLWTMLAGQGAVAHGPLPGGSARTGTVATGLRSPASALPSGAAARSNPPPTEPHSP